MVNACKKKREREREKYMNKKKLNEKGNEGVEGEREGREGEFSSSKKTFFWK